MIKLKNDEIKKIQIDMLKYIDNICVEHDINYTLIGGSLIGAIRHKGMIPWDDDIDVGMLRDDYNKLINILKSNNNKNYSLLNHNTNSKYYFAFSKLVCNYTKLIEKDFEEIDGYGIYIDIFCYNYATSDKKIAIKYFKKQQKLNFLLGGIKEVNKGSNKYFLKQMRHFFIRIYGINKIFKKLYKLHNKYSDGRYLISDWNVYSFDKELKKKDYFNEYIRVQFENIEVSIIKKYDEFLKGTFSNYMELPPVENRVNHELKVYLKNDE